LIIIAEKQVLLKLVKWCKPRG